MSMGMNGYTIEEFGQEFLHHVGEKKQKAGLKAFVPTITIEFQRRNEDGKLFPIDYCLEM